jgi:hypothetical protein
MSKLSALTLALTLASTSSLRHGSSLRIIQVEYDRLADLQLP